MAGSGASGLFSLELVVGSSWISMLNSSSSMLPLFAATIFSALSAGSTFFPHMKQNRASSGSFVPQYTQYIAWLLRSEFSGVHGPFRE